MSSNAKFLAGLVAGVGVGTLIGILIAPEKGTETYKKLEGALKDAANDLMDIGNSALHSAKENVETAQNN